MAAFNVTALANFGYNETTRYMDPMEERWRAKKFADDELASRTGPFSEEAIRAMVDEYTIANPYSEVDQVEKALDDYWMVTQSKRADADSEASSPRNEPMGPVPRYRRMVV